MADFAQTLAQLLAQNKQANAVTLSNPQAGQMNFQTGKADAGYGQIGENFGKGIGDYIKETFVQAQKNKYMQENDPIEIEKRANKFYDIYNNAPEAEQDRIDKWLNETPDGLKWLDKLNKNASHLMTKVPLPKDYIAKPGEAPDDVTWYRPLRTIKTRDQQRNEAMAQMAPGKRENVLFAPEGVQLAEAGLRNAQTVSEPITAAAHKLGSEAQMVGANAQASNAATEKEILQYRIAAEKARADLYRAKENNVKTTKDPLGQKLLIEKAKIRQQALNIASNDFRAETAAISKETNPYTKLERTWTNQARYAATVIAHEPLSQDAVNKYSDALNDISSRSDDPSAPKYYQIGLNILNSWEANCNTWKSWQALHAAKERFLYRYAKIKYGQGTFTGPSGAEIKLMIKGELGRQFTKENSLKVMRDESRYKKEQKELDQIQVDMPAPIDLGGVL